MKTNSGAHTTSYSMGVSVLSREQSGRGLKLTTHLHTVPRLRMSGDIPLVPLHAVMVLAASILTLS
jgi:hypothetical protein